MKRLFALCLAFWLFAASDPATETGHNVEGDTGRAAPPELHFEILLEDEEVDPEEKLPDRSRE